MTRKNVILANLIWRFAERCGAQLVQFVVSIVLARILMPEDYGTVALITVFITILQVFVDSGLGNALIQKKDADDVDFTTVFFTNVIFCLILYGLIFLCAPLIARFYKNDLLTPLVRVLGITVIISGVKNVQQAYVSRHMLFKNFFYATLGGTIGAAIIGIIMAYSGFGVWALVAQQVFNVTVDTVILWFTVKWRPGKTVSIERLRKLYSFGWKLLASTLLDTVYNNIRQLIIGKLYSSSDLAYYNRGKQFPNIIVTNINSSISSVLLPAMSNVQDDKEKVKNMTRLAIKVSVYVMAPLMMGVAFTAPSIVKIILTEKWMDAVPYIRIFCITYMFYPIHTANLNAINAMGRSDLFLKLEIAKKIVGMICLISTMWFGVMAMAYSLLLVSVLSQLINAWPNRRLLNYGYIDQIKDILPSVLLAVFMGVGVSTLNNCRITVELRFVCQIVLGGGIYVVGSIITKNDSYLYLKKILISAFKNREG